jgi:ferredoxin
MKNMPVNTDWDLAGAAPAAQHSPAAERNRQPILQALQQLLPAQGLALEIASGTGQHAAWFAAGLPGWVWQPSDVQADGFDSIAAWCRQAGVRNVREPVLLDVLAAQWPAGWPEFTGSLDLMYCANMLHIAPWATCAALMRGAARYLAPQGLLITYGPYLEDGVPTSPGNRAFDESLRQRDPAWGLRLVQDVVQQAAQAGLCLSERREMPANNLLLVFRRAQHFTARVAHTEQSFDAWGHQPLLLAAEQAGLSWPASCRNGTCRACIGRLASGQVHYRIAWPGLSADEKAGGAVLPCVAYPVSDVLLEGPGF